MRFRNWEELLVHAEFLGSFLNIALPETNDASPEAVPRAKAPSCWRYGRRTRNHGSVGSSLDSRTVPFLAF